MQGLDSVSQIAFQYHWPLEHNQSAAAGQWLKYRWAHWEVSSFATDILIMAICENCEEWSSHFPQHPAHMWFSHWYSLYYFQTHSEGTLVILTDLILIVTHVVLCQMLLKCQIYNLINLVWKQSVVSSKKSRIFVKHEFHLQKPCWLSLLILFSRNSSSSTNGRFQNFTQAAS